MHKSIKDNDIELILTPDTWEWNKKLNLPNRKVLQLRRSEQLSYWEQRTHDEEWTHADDKRFQFADEAIQIGLLAMKNLGIYTVKENHADLIRKYGNLHICYVINFPLDSQKNIENLIISMNEHFVKS